MHNITHHIINSAVVSLSLRLAHPFAPFVTETIWQTLGWHEEQLISSHWPQPIEYSDISAAQFEQLQLLVNESRYVTSELPGNKKYTLLYQEDSLIEENRELIKHLAKLEEVTQADQARGLRLAASNREAWLDVDDDTLYEHQTNLEVRIAETKQFISNLEGRLGNASYVDKAPERLVEETRQQLVEKQDLLVRLARELEVLS